MRVFINDKVIDCASGVSLKQVLEENGVNTDHAAVALDFEVIPREAWDKTMPREDSSIIIIKAAQGG
ncbi:MAG: sulfur carrier protein ThiS [Odoribacteraceae bacterium]|jgi:thiamine biosynthesis protein ThiS|nr:sulfur carrier protein ThiS [Odoribacteraceae bacterium]